MWTTVWAISLIVLAGSVLIPNPLLRYSRLLAFVLLFPTFLFGGVLASSADRESGSASASMEVTRPDTWDDVHAHPKRYLSFSRQEIDARRPREFKLLGTIVNTSSYPIKDVEL